MNVLTEPPPHAPTRAERVAAAFTTAAAVGQRTTRLRGGVHRTPCHVPPDLEGAFIRGVQVGPPGPQCLPARDRTITLTQEWLRHHQGLVATLDAPWLVLHAPEASVVYVKVREDWPLMRTTFRRVDQVTAVFR